MKLISRLMMFSFLAAIILVSTAKAQTTGGITLESLVNDKITGAWHVNYAESDNPMTKIQATLENSSKSLSSDADTNSKSSELPPISVSLVPPETLILAGDDEKSITINEGYNQTILTRTFETDGKTRSGELYNGISFSVMAAQDGNSLKVETTSPRGNKMTETYAVEDKGKKLIVTVRFETAQAKEIMTLRRVYDRAVLDIFSEDVMQTH